MRWFTPKNLKCQVTGYRHARKRVARWRPTCRSVSSTAAQTPNKSRGHTEGSWDGQKRKDWCRGTEITNERKRLICFEKSTDNLSRNIGATHKTTWAKQSKNENILTSHPSMYFKKFMTFTVMEVCKERIWGERERDRHARQDIRLVSHQSWNERDINLNLSLIIMTPKPELEVTHNSK